MVFSSILFIFRFLPLSLALYYITPNRFKNFILFILSLSFYFWGEAKYFVVIIASIVVDYTIGILIEKYRINKLRTKVFLGISIFFNLGILVFFKYSNFFIDNINYIFSSDISNLNLSLPLGISFYTFQTMSYSIDVYRQKIKAERNIINFAAFVVLFPQLIAGPIVKYKDIKDELKVKNLSFSKIEKGIRLFILGLSRKVLIANNVGLLWEDIKSIGYENISTSLAWLGILAFTIQIYFDFSGYSLMARALGAMFGFTFPKNFDYPFISRSVSEFWRRWHKTLGDFFKEYVYIPMGGDRKGVLRLFLNLFIVWFLTGFWHGASYNFILWGLYFFILISIEKIVLNKLLDRNKLLSHIYLIIAILISFVFFGISDFKMIKIYLFKLFYIQGGVSSIYYLSNYFMIIVISILFSTPYVNNIYNKYIKNKSYLDIFILMILFIVSIAYLVDLSYNPFLYFRF